MIFLSHGYIALRKDKHYLHVSSVEERWVGIIACKCLDRKDMCDIKDIFYYLFYSYQRLLARWKSDGFIIASIETHIHMIIGAYHPLGSKVD
jgi:hypothetical protein